MKNALAVTLSMNNSVIHWLECRFIQINIYCLLKYSLYIKSPSIQSVYLIVIIMVSSTLMRKVPPILYFFNSSFPLDETAWRSNICIFFIFIKFLFLQIFLQTKFQSISLQFLKKKETFQNLKIDTLRN